MPLVRRNGKLLRRNGKLASGLECCDCDPPDECPECCVRIAWGTFDSNGNLVGEVEASSGATVTLTIIMPTPGSRIVCDEDEIAIQWTITNYEGTGSNGAWVRFGPAWRLSGNTPSVNSGDGKVYDWGLVDWGTLDEDSYSVSLTFRKCFLDVSEFLGYIWIGMSDPAMELEIDIERCPAVDWCCRDVYECEDCCALLDMGEVIQYDNKFYKVSQSNDANGIYTGIVEITLEEPGMICLGQGLEISVYLVPPRHSLAPTNNMVVDHPTPWKQTSNSPAISLVDGAATDEETDWGTLDSTEYSISLEIDCDEDPAVIIDAIPAIVVSNAQYSLDASISFDVCNLEGCCYDCSECPPTSAIITVVVAGNGATDGEYEATWDEGQQAWVGTVAGCTTWITCRMEFGIVYFDMLRGNPPPTGCGITVPCLEPLAAETPENDCCWYAAPGGATVSVKVKL